MASNQHFKIKLFDVTASIVTFKPRQLSPNNKFQLSNRDVYHFVKAINWYSPNGEPVMRQDSVELNLFYRAKNESIEKKLKNLAGLISTSVHHPMVGDDADILQGLAARPRLLELYKSLSNEEEPTTMTVKDVREDAQTSKEKPQIRVEPTVVISKGELHRRRRILGSELAAKRVRLNTVPAEDQPSDIDSDSVLIESDTE